MCLIFFFFFKEFHTGLWLAIFLEPKGKVNAPGKEWNHRLLAVLVLKVTFKGEGKWILLINQSVKPIVNIKVGMFLHISSTENSLCPSNTHTQIKEMLLICFSIKNTNSFRSHEWINHLLYQIKCHFSCGPFLFVFQLLYWRGSSWLK